MVPSAQATPRPTSESLVRTAVLAALLLPGVSTCTPTPPAQPGVANETDPVWVAQATPHAKVAVVFVHGVFGDTRATWTHSSGETFFRLLKAQPELGPKVDIFAFGFTSNMFVDGSLDIREAANRLHDSLQYKGVLDYPTIVFAAHSMGGLVVLRELLTRREMLSKVPLVVLYSTPQEGAQISSVAKHVAHNPALEQMVPGDRNAYLQQLNDDWRSLPARPHVACAYEKLPTYGMLIVPWTSATRFCDGAPSAIEADHIQIAKPDRLEHPSVVVLVNALSTYVLGVNLAAKLETPDFTPEGDHLVLSMTGSGKAPARLVNSGGAKLSYTLAQIDPLLHVWPDDTPRELSAGTTQLMHAALSFGADRAEYRFVLQSDAAPALTVIARVGNLAELREQLRALRAEAFTDMSAALRAPEMSARLASAEAEAAVAGVVKKTIARRRPELPESMQWVLAASLLETSNLPRIAASALRSATGLSPALARSSSAQLLATAIAAQAGEAPVFAISRPPTLTPEYLRVHEAVDDGSALELARGLQRIPALKAYGLSLQGDVLAASGDAQSALTAYEQAAAIATTPSLSNRIRVLRAPDAPPGPSNTPRGPVTPFRVNPGVR